MKKLALLLISVLTLVSCDSDDGPNVAYDYAEITGEDLPEYFELGEEYEINVTYELPDACHTFYGFTGGDTEDEDDETIYVYEIYANTSYDPNLECTEEATDLSETKNLFERFRLPATFQYDTVRFKFLTAVSSTNEGEYMIVDVPVGAPDEDEDDIEEETDGEDTGDEASN